MEDSVVAFSEIRMRDVKKHVTSKDVSLRTDTDQALMI
jgi:hypothetical protein